MSYLQIGGVTVKPPKSFSIAQKTIDADSSGRNASGRMVRDVIAVKRKIECEWGPLSTAEISAIMNRIKGDFFTVTYLDPEVGGMTTKTFYAGTQTAPIYSWNEKFQVIMWEGLSVNFVEQ